MLCLKQLLVPVSIRPAQWQITCFFYLDVWSLLVSDISNSQQQSTAGYKEKSKSLLGLSLPTRVKNITNTIYVQKFKYANAVTVPTCPCMSNDLVYG